MADRADAAGAGGQRGHLIKGAPDDELFKAPHLGDLKMGIIDLAGRVKKQADFGMAFNAGDWLDGNAVFHGRLLGTEPGVEPQFGRLPRNQGTERGEQGVGGGRASGNKQIHGNEMVQGQGFVVEDRQIGCGNLRA